MFPAIALLLALTSSSKLDQLDNSVLTVTICNAGEPAGSCLSINEAQNKISSSTMPNIELNGLRGQNMQLYLSSNAKKFTFSNCADCTIEITGSAIVVGEKGSNVKCIVHGDESIITSNENHAFYQALAVIDTTSDIKELTYYYKAPSKHTRVDVCLMNKYLENGNQNPSFKMPIITLVDNGLTYSSPKTKDVLLGGKIKFSLAYFEVEETVLDKEVCIGDSKGCLPVDEAVKIADQTVAEFFHLTGDLTDRSIVITPKQTMKYMSINSFKGTVQVKKNDLLYVIEGNKDLTLKIQGTGTFQKERETIEDKTYVQLFVPNHGLKQADFTFYEVGDVKEIYVAVYLPNGIELPKITGTGDGKKYTLKTKDYVITNSRKLKEETETYKVAYFEVSNMLSGGAIAGIVIACIVVVAGIAVGVFFVLKNKGKEASSDPGAKA